MLSFLVKPPQRTRVAHLNKIAFDDGRSCIEFKAPSDQYLVINRLPPAPQEEASTDKHGIEGPSSPNCALNPPLHWHSRQDEFFHVLHGKAAFYLEDRKHIATAGEVVEIPGGVYHTFRNASPKDDLVVEFVLEPRHKERDEEFFRNTQTYRDDCRKAGIPRNLCQVLMFNYRANVVLALPGPKFIAKPLGLLLNFFAAWAGTVIFGFRDSYPEYFDRQRPSSRP
ncbi:RmlC-like cupin domain-containing protein [Exophiala viscosa]|uniref:RmlC-like cupin domain-containing protein n=1 Tax=Exophiala viscosa TaxID=2486360 RepID=A0AAN6E4R2_9EURO|nr:RmlC-like cupin domain-containing protein [Exophiala viscosa]